MKHVFYAGLALVALASCSQDETTDVDKTGSIGFRTSLGKTTRAEIKLNNLNSFNVTAFPNAGGSNYFADLAVSSSDAGVTWNTASVYYWPAGTLDFTAYAPTSISSRVSIAHGAGNQKITGFEPEQTVANQKDVVAAFRSGDKATYGASGVPMNFKHILSQIEVQAKCTNANLRVRVVGVKLANVNSKGDFAFPQVATATSYEVPLANWSNLSTLNQYGVESATPTTPVELNITAQNIMFGTDNFLMIPQQLTAYEKTSAPSGAYIGVLCRMDINDGHGNYTALYPSAITTQYAFAAVGIGTEWKPGKKYVYTLEFGDGGGVVPPNQDNPNPGGGTVTPPVGPDFPSNPGDPILNNPIKFTVTVDNWTEQSENLNM